MKFFDKEAGVSTYAPYVGAAAGGGLGALGTKLFKKHPKKKDYFTNTILGGLGGLSIGIGVGMMDDAERAYKKSKGFADDFGRGAKGSTDDFKGFADDFGRGAKGSTDDFNFKDYYKDFRKKYNEQQRKNRRWWEGSGKQYSRGAKSTKSSYGKVDDLLQRLGISKGKVKSQKDVKKAFRNMAKKFHPDRGGNPEKMKDINKAWSKIKNTSFWENLSKTAFLRRMI